MYIIQQHTCDIQCSSQVLGKEMQSHLSTLLEKNFYPELEKLFDKYDIKNHTWCIDELVIELPVVSEKYWKEELVSHSLRQIEDYLKRNQVANSQLNNNCVSNSQYAELIFFQFLKTGKISENPLAKDLEKLVKEVEVTEKFITELELNFDVDINYLLRWISAVPDFFKDRVLRKIKNFPNTIQPLLDSEMIHKIVVNSNLKKQWIEFVQWMFYLQKGKVSKGNKANEIIQYSNDFFTIKKQDLKLICQEFSETYSKSDSINFEIINYFQDIVKRIDGNGKVDNNKQKHIILENNNKLQDTDTIDVHFIANAGLVILHPFLKSLFEQSGLCDNNGNWATIIKHHKAVLLTQYLIFGNDLIQESDLALNKILCGFPQEGVVNVQIEINEEDKEKCNSLLEAVKEHWKEMKQSSIEGLQHNFLQRDGKLALGSVTSIELWVEERGFDILLERLPWGINTIKTPWMENYLTCNWNY